MTSQHTLGVALIVLSATAFSSAGIFTKAVSADAWSVIFWRGLSAAAFALVFLLVTAKLRAERQRFGGPALLATLLMASGTAAFIPAFKLTSVAHVALIWATAPFVTTLLAWICIGERPGFKTALCSVIAVAGAGLTVSGSLGNTGIIGDMLAFWMTLMMAATMVVYRRWPSTPTVLPSAVSSLMLLVPAVILTRPATVPFTEVSILLAFGLIFALASVMMMEGVRRIPAAQAALISALETPLAPIWALILLAEVPTPRTIAGGALIMAAVVFSQSPRAFLHRLRTTRQARRDLNIQLLRDAGYDPHTPTKPLHWRDPLHRDIRRLW